MRLHAVFVTIAIQSVSGSWNDGHLGVSRTGSGSVGDVIRPVSTANHCFDLCHHVKSCQAWTFTPSGCNGARQDLCALHQSVRPARLVAGEECLKVASGTVDAVDGLVPLKWRPLKLGTIQPAGWLLNQLVIFANGLSGHLDLFWADVNESVWIGGGADHSGAGHERGPYWLNGMVPLVAQLNASGVISTVDVDINAQVQHWITYILDHQLPSGWLGPDDGFGGKGNDYWSGWNIAASLLSYADAMPDGDPMATRCNAAVLKYIKIVYERMQTTPTTQWTQNRWQDWVYIIHWLLDTAPQGQEQLLWDAAELTQQQSWDWDAYYSQAGVGTSGAYVGKPIPKFPEENVGGWTMYDHGVNNAMGTKSCATWFRQSKNVSDAEKSYHKLAMQDQFHGQPHGMFSADECFGGRNLNRGIELCAVVEQMYSLQHMFRVSGDPMFLDRHERIQYNSLPGTITPTSWAHQYLQQANEINAMYGLKDHVWQTDGADSTGFGVAPNFGCCTANMQQGWPKMVNNLLLQSENGALLLALISPFKAVLASQGEIVVDTAYPFSDIVTITITKPTAAFDFSIRIPAWATKATVSMVVDGKTTPTQPVSNGTIYTLKAIAVSSKTVITLALNPEVRVETGWGNLGKPAASVVPYSPSGASVPSNTEDDFVLGGEASFTADTSRQSTDIRTGDPGGSATITLAHLIAGNGHNVTGCQVSFTYVAGYGPVGPVTGKRGSTVSIAFADSRTGSSLGVVWTSPQLQNYSFDKGDPFSPPVVANLRGLNIVNWAPITMALQIANNDRNLQIKLASISIKVSWGTAKDPRPSPPPKPFLVPPTNAATVVRGPLVYSLLLNEQAQQVKAWEPFNNLDINIVTSSAWNYALDLSKPITYEALGAPSSIPFNTSNYPAVLRATAKQLPGWVAHTNAADEPPTSPIDCPTVAGGCAASTSVTLVPYGMTDLRMAGLPWISSH